MTIKSIPISPATPAESPSVKTNCRSCEKTIIINKGNAVAVKDGYACRACYSNFYIRCTACSDAVEDLKIAYVEGRAHCRTCVSKIYRMCDDCTQYRVIDAVREVHTSMEHMRTVCNHCWASYRICKRCEHFSYDVRNEYCKQCRSCEYILPYRAKVTRYIPVQGIKRSNPRKNLFAIESQYSTRPMERAHLLFGVEVEVRVKEEHSIKEAAAAALETVKEFAILKEDNSISYGFEIVSAPATFDFHTGGGGEPPCWDAFFNLVNSSDYFVNNSPDCGMHIHISKSALTPMQIGKMVVFVHSPENRDLIEYIAERGSNKYNDFTKDKRITDYYDRTGDRQARYTAVNLLPELTVEIRIFQMILSRESVYKNLEFTKALISFCSMGAHSYRDMSAYKFMAYIEKYRKSYPYLYEFMKKREPVLVA